MTSGAFDIDLVSSGLSFLERKHYVNDGHFEDFSTGVFRLR